MKNKFLFIAMATGLILAADPIKLSAQQATKIALTQAPPTIQKAMGTLIAKAPNPQIEKKVLQGKDYYVATFNKNGKPAEAAFSPDGSLFRINGQHVPVPVIVTFDKERAGVPVGDFGLETTNGKKIFHFAFAPDANRYVHLRIDDKGTLLTKDSNPIAIATPNGSAKVILVQLPAAAQHTVKAQVGSNQINDIDAQTKNGQTVYEVGFKKNGQQTEIRVGEDGTFLGQISPVIEAAGATPTSRQNGSSKVTFNELPAAAQKAVKEQTGFNEINDIDRIVKNGKTVYEVGFKKDGQQTEIRVDENGAFLGQVSPVNKPIDALTPTIPAPNLPQTGSTKVSFNGLPAAVQKAAKEQAGSNEINDIDKNVRNGKVVYEVGFKKDGQQTELLINEDGSLQPK